MRCVGLDQLCAANEDAYAEIAIGLASNLDQLAQLRRTLRERMLASPVMDAAGFTREFERALHAM
jgi:predicted O-linked N-acetylglucosamine transferase (SPINDLY family)